MSRHHTGRGPVPLGTVCFRQSTAPRFDKLQGLIHLPALLFTKLSVPKLGLGFMMPCQSTGNLFLRL